MSLAAQVLAARSQVAAAATERFLLRHPDWLVRFGDRARAYGIQDATFHLEFLAGSLVIEDAGAFQDYVAWTARVLAARGIEPVFLAENLDDIADELASRLGPAADAAVQRLRDGRTTLEGSPTAVPPTLPVTARLFLQAALVGDRRASWKVLEEALSAGTPALTLYTDVLETALYEVGRLWESGVVTVAQEHLATAVAQYVSVLLRSHVPVSAARRERVLVTTVQGERHQVGAQLVCDVLEADGWSVHFAGSDVPHDGILKAVADLQPAVVGISAATLPSLAAVERLVTALRAAGTVRVLVGGAVFRRSPDAWQKVGADGWAPNLASVCEAFANPS